ncbi:MAG TPA: DmsC/YnfH family molybdoenzyme membrane anchor subunit [Dokdonella sp.]|nr:DmsC/YnfH family molybdoenzyme membrane anchor subunit [Dokdonella sp.]
MRPTFSIICFTVLSGIGYGAWFLLGLGWTIGPICKPGMLYARGETLDQCSAPFATPAGLAVAFLLVSAALLCSLGHLGKPRRAWRALSQWRSSWLSREGIASLLTFIPASILLAQSIGIPWLQWSATGGHAAASGWFGTERSDLVLGSLLSAGSALTVICTANIYARLEPIRAWHERHVVPAYLLLGLYGGGILLLAATTLDGRMWLRDRQLLLIGTTVLAAIGAWIKLRYWRSIDAQPPVTAGHATGLEGLGAVRAFEAPHTEENYLLHEMAFVLARKHARKLRRIALVAAFLVPALLASLALALPAAQSPAAWFALASGVAGLFVERWLFFAEAKHAVIAYYQR